jgi:hypothetical protein
MAGNPRRRMTGRQPEVLWSPNAEAERLQARLAIGHDTCDGSRAIPTHSPLDFVAASSELPACVSRWGWEGLR